MKEMIKFSLHVVVMAMYGKQYKTYFPTLFYFSTFFTSLYTNEKIAKSSIISQKGESQNGCFKKKSKSHFPKNELFLPPDMHTYACISGGKKCSFFGKFGVLCFLERLVLRFALLPHYRRNMKNEDNICKYCTRKHAITNSSFIVCWNLIWHVYLLPLLCVIELLKTM